MGSLALFPRHVSSIYGVKGQMGGALSTTCGHLSGSQTFVVFSKSILKRTFLKSSSMGSWTHRLLNTSAILWMKKEPYAGCLYAAMSANTNRCEQLCVTVISTGCCRTHEARCNEE